MPLAPLAPDTDSSLAKAARDLRARFFAKLRAAASPYRFSFSRKPASLDEPHREHLEAWDRWAGAGDARV